ncbi:MAG: AAA family ATPase [Pseudonocardiaceae bacterium]
MALAGFELPRAVPDFIGRTAELHILGQCAARVRAACPWVACLSGAAGIGKTMLVRRFLSELDEFTVLTASARQVCQADAYGVLTMLLPARQQAVNAVETTVVSAAATLLAVLGELQADGPVVVVVDDVQWADHYSVRALGFVLRRLGADQVLVVLVCRDGDSTGSTWPPELAGRRENLTEIRLGGLTVPEVAALVETHLGGTISAPAAQWMCSYTRGHPLHLRVLLAEGVMARPDGGDRSMAPSLDATIVEWFRRQPVTTQRLLGALAVVDRQFPLLRLARLAEIENPAAALEPAVEAGFVDWWPSEPSSPVAFRHPLHREALYATLSPRRRSRLHRAAVELVDRRSGWAHRVAAAAGTDDELAGDLEQAAVDEAARREYDTAANYLRWAAQLSTQRDEYERRLLTGCLLSLRDFRTA